MKIYVALLRAVNLAGHNQIAMRDLCVLLTELGMEEPRSLLQSGNLVFRSAVSTSAELERLLEEAAEKSLGLKTDFFVRTAPDWKAVIAANPFVEEARLDPAHLLVAFLRRAPERSAVTALRNAIKGREVVEVKGKQAYLVYPDGVGRSRLTSAIIEGKLGTRGTGRNWNTVLKLAGMIGVS